MKSDTLNQNYINHFALVLDESGSMRDIASQVVQVADQQITYWATRSKEMDQETRVTVYTFNSGPAKCLFYDKDVLRLPSLKGLYHPQGQTALIDAAIKSIDDLKQTPQLYGDHAFLVYVLTDGAENQSSQKPSDLNPLLSSLPDNWTIAAFVPGVQGVFEAKQCGFEKDNIQIWDTTSKGMTEVARVMRQATDSYMKGRASGVRGTRSLFNLKVGALNKKAMTTLDKLGPGQFRLLPIPSDTPIAKFIEHNTKRPYKKGEGYYQLTKTETVQANKEIAIFDRKNYTVYTGKHARKLLNLPDYELPVAANYHSEYVIYIQSNSVNRKLIGGTNLLLLS